MRFDECNYIRKQENLIIIAGAGIDKSRIATALGHQARTPGHKASHVNMLNCSQS
jgi:hypothetical protein